MSPATVRWTGGRAAEEDVHRKDLERMLIQLGHGLVHPVLEESLFIEGHSAHEHEVDHPSELLCDNRESFRLAVLADELLVKQLCRFVLPKEQDGRLAESPFEVSVADLVVGAARTFAGRLVRTLHQP